LIVRYISPLRRGGWHIPWSVTESAKSRRSGNSTSEHEGGGSDWRGHRGDKPSLTHPAISCIAGEGAYYRHRVEEWLSPLGSDMERV
jgi:hypothetical protein